METLNSVHNGADNRAGWTRQSRLRGCLVVFLVPMLVALVLAVLRPQARIQSLQIPAADYATVSPDGQSIALPAGPLKNVMMDNDLMSGYDQVDIRSTAVP